MERDAHRTQIMFGALCSRFKTKETEPTARAAELRRLAEGFFLRHEFNLDKVAKPATSAAAEYEELQRIQIAFATGNLDAKQRDNELRQLFRRTYPLKPEVLVAVSQAAEQGTDASTDRPFPAGEMLLACAARHPEWLLPANQMKLVTGEELMKLGFKGRALGEMQNQIEQLRDDGQIETREQALEYLKTQAA